MLALVRRARLLRAPRPRAAGARRAAAGGPDARPPAPATGAPVGAPPPPPPPPSPPPPAADMTSPAASAVERDRVLTVPNALTLARLGLAPYVAWAVLGGLPGRALAAFAVAGALDAADGWVARTFDQASVLGSYLDPLADKVLVGAAAASLAATGGLPPAAVAVWLARDAALLAGAAAFRRATLPPGVPLLSPAHASLPRVEPSALSKLNTGLQLGLIGAALAAGAAGVDAGGALAAASAVVTGTTVASGVDYWRRRPRF